MQLRKKAFALAGSLTVMAAYGACVMAADPAGGGLLESVGQKVYGSTPESNPAVIVGNIIKAAIALLGVVFLILMVYAGYLWMIARGDKEMVQRAKDTIQRAIIGIIIVSAAYAIASFVIGRLAK